MALRILATGDIHIGKQSSSIGVIPATVELFVGTGIIFYQEINGDLYELAQGNAMKLAAVG